MTRVLANASAADRPPTDFYRTPSDVTVALLSVLGLSSDEGIWEPAAGDGAMAQVMRAYGYHVVESDLASGADFLHATAAPESWIITNPPFSQAEEFIRHAFELAPMGGFAFLLKSQFWHAARRLKLFNEIRPSGVYPLSWRPDFLFGAKSSAPTMEVLWTVWRTYYGGVRTTEYLPLARPLP